MVLSSCETEHVTTSYVACQTLLLEMLLEDLDMNNCVQIKLVMDNQSTSVLENISMSHGRIKHLERRYNFLRNQVGKERLRYEYYKIELQLADILTKPLKHARFECLNGLMEMRKRIRIRKGNKCSLVLYALFLVKF